MIELNRCPLEKLRAFADLSDYNMLLDPVKLKEIAVRGDDAHDIKGFDIPHNPAVCSYKPYGTYFPIRYVVM